MFWRRGLVVGIVVLLVGAVFLPCFSGNIKNMSVRASDYHRAATGKNIIYVDDDSPSPGDGTWDWPYCKIQDAIDNACAGDDIHVCNGTYKDKGPVCRIDKSLTIYAGGDDPHGGDTQYPPIINASYFNNTIVVTTNDVTITGFDITGSSKENGTAADGGLVYWYSGIRVEPVVSNCNILKNIIHHNGAGIRAYGYTFIINNTICDNLDDGIKVRAGYIENNYIARNGRVETKALPSNADGIEIYGISGTSIINNTIIDNQVDGIWDDTGDRHTISGNIIENNHQGGIDLFEARRCMITNNNIISNGYFGIYMNVGSSNTIANNNISNNVIGIFFKSSSSNSIENNIISYNTQIGIYLEESSSNNFIKNFILYNIEGIYDYKSSNNIIYNNDFRENNISIELTFSIRDVIVFNNIATTSTIKLRATCSFAIAPINWWGDWRGPWHNMKRRISFVLVFPWSPIEFPINSASTQYLKNSYPKV